MTTLHLQGYNGGVDKWPGVHVFQLMPENPNDGVFQHAEAAMWYLVRLCLSYISPSLVLFVGFPL